jgi:hypothetical protein
MKKLGETMGLWLVALCFVQAIAVRATATCIIVTVTPDAVVVGADTRQISLGPSGRAVSVVHKIVRVGRLFYAFAGTKNAPDLTAGGLAFNTDAIARAVCGSGTPLRSKIEEFGRAFIGPYEKLLNGQRANPFYADVISKGGRLDIVFFGFEKGHPSAALGSFVIADNKAPRLAVVNDKKDFLPNGRASMFALGENDAIGSDSFAFLGAHGAIPTICHLIQEESDALGPEGDVAGPIDVVRVPQTGRPEVRLGVRCVRNRAR